MLSILFGFGSAIGWGVADFVGGLASRKTSAYRAIFYPELIGIVFIVAAALIFFQPIPSAAVGLLAFFAGAIGSTGLLFLYQAMTRGLMSIAAPVSALLAAIIPIAVGAFTEGLPKLVTMFGFGLALLAIWFISQGESGVKDIFAHIADLRLPLLAGVGFGLYFVLMHEATRTATFWPMLFSRSGGLVIIAAYMVVRRETWSVDRTAWPLMTMNAICDVGGNFFYVLAGQMGRLDVAAILGSMFPALTVLLAALVLKERVTPLQSVGIFLALAAIILMTL